jgi:hypothetical protein
MLAAINAVQTAKAPWARDSAYLCEELHMEPAAARVRLRHAQIKTTGGAYAWPAGSDDLKKARDALAQQPIE